MKALVFRGPGSMPLEERLDPSPGPGEVVVEVRASGICGSDVHGFAGATGRRRVGVVMGHEATGEVVQTESDVTTVRVGDRVVLRSILSCGRCASCRTGRPNLCLERQGLGMHLDGAYAERVGVPEALVVGLPDELGYEVGSLVEPLAVAMHAVNITPFDLRDTIVVVGAGPIGLLALLAARRSGAGQIIVTDRDPHRLELARTLGADTTVHVGEADPVEAVRAATAGQPQPPGDRGGGLGRRRGPVRRRGARNDRREQLPAARAPRPRPRPRDERRVGRRRDGQRVDLRRGRQHPERAPQRPLDHSRRGRAIRGLAPRGSGGPRRDGCRQPPSRAPAARHRGRDPGRSAAGGDRCRRADHGRPHGRDRRGVPIGRPGLARRPARRPGWRAVRRLLVLSHPLRADAPVWPTNPPAADIELADSMARGDPDNTTILRLFSHSGTHVDTPWHFNADGPAAWQLPIDTFVFDSPRLIEVPAGERTVIGPSDLEPHTAALGTADVVMLRTGWSDLRSTDPRRFAEEGPVLHPDAARWLVDRHPALRAIATDAISIGAPWTRPLSIETHRVLTGVGRSDGRFVLIYEDVRLVPEAAAAIRVHAWPLFVEGADGSPCTIVAELRQD